MLICARCNVVFTREITQVSLSFDVYGQATILSLNAYIHSTTLSCVCIYTSTLITASCQKSRGKADGSNGKHGIPPAPAVMPPFIQPVSLYSLGRGSFLSFFPPSAVNFRLKIFGYFHRILCAAFHVSLGLSCNFLRVFPGRNSVQRGNSC